MASRPKTTDGDEIAALFDQFKNEKDKLSISGGAKSHGLRTGMGLLRFMIHLFEANEIRHGTNAALERVLLAEFPGNTRLLKSFGPNPKGKARINWFRYNYNTGKLVRRKGIQILPDCLSMRYNEEGKAVDSRTGLYELDKDAIRSLAFQYNIQDPRFFNQKELGDFDKLRDHWLKERLKALKAKQ